MSKTGSLARVGLVAVLFLSACDGDEPAASDAADVRNTSNISVTVPAERQTPFCETMIDLTDELRSGDLDDPEAAIIEAYRSVTDDVPPEIAVDFRLVLDALESGAPPPTDPAIETTQPTSPQTTAPPVTDPSDTTETSDGSDGSEGSVDEGFAPGRSPAERINNYVTFACRDTQNNPGPPPTQPLTETPENDDG